MSMTQPQSRKSGPLAWLNRRWFRWPLLLIGIAIFVMLWDFQIFKNFDTVVPGKIYRSGQPGEAQLERWINEYELKTILVIKPTLREYTVELAQQYGLNLVHRPLSTREGPSEEQWQEIKELLTDEENFPLLYHCHGGSDKAGIVTAMYRIEVQDWPLGKALLEMDMHYHIPFQYPGLQRYLKDRYGALDD